jgi:hypothetical protein
MYLDILCYDNPVKAPIKLIESWLKSRESDNAFRVDDQNKQRDKLKNKSSIMI